MRSKLDWRKLWSVFCVSLFLLMAQAAHAQNWPTKTLHIRVGWSPGGTTDVLSRIVAQKLQESLGVPVVVENRPGASGSLEAAALSKAPLDDHVFMMVPVGVQAINQFLYKSIGYDPENDFTSVGLVAQIPNALAVNASAKVNFRTFKEFIDYAKANSNKLNYSSAGIGTTGHMLNELLEIRAGVELTHVPYKGNGPALQALLANEVEFNTDNNAQLLQYIRAGKLRALAVSSEKRWAQLPDIPTFAELGYPEMTTQVWYGMVAKSKMPKEIVNRMNKELNAILAKPDMIARLKDMNLEAVPSTPEDMASFVRRERERWKKVVEVSGARAD